MNCHEKIVKALDNNFIFHSIFLICWSFSIFLLIQGDYETEFFTDLFSSITLCYIWMWFCFLWIRAITKDFR
jgi:hypothetical protein